MGELATRAIHLVLLGTGSLALALALCLSALHWVTCHRGRDAGVWAIGAYGATALALWDILGGTATNWTAIFVTGAVCAAYISGRRSHAQVVLVARPTSRGEAA